MRELLHSSYSMWLDFWKGGGHIWILLICAVCLFLIRKKHEDLKSLLIYSALLVIAFFCPIFEKIVMYCLGDKNVYWRVLWLIPEVVVISYFVTMLISMISKRVLQTIAVFAMISVIAVTGTSMIQAGHYEKTGNRQQVPDNVAVICDIIRADAQGDEIYVAADDSLASYIRVYDPSFKMPYGRRGAGAVDRFALRMYQLLTNYPGQYIGTCVKITDYLGCNYLVAVVGEEFFETSMFEDYHMELIDTVGAYRIFRRNG